jgi:hypothetical protein
MYDAQEQCLSDADIKRELPNVKIINYSDLDGYSSIEQLLPRRLDAVVILVELKENVGHWVCVIRSGKKGDSIVFFDPYGVRPDKELSWISPYMNKKLGQDIPHMSYLLNKAVDDGFKVSFNNVKYQKQSPAINTCGRHCISVIRYFRETPNPSLKKYKAYMDRLVKDNHLNYDLIVTRMTA